MKFSNGFALISPLLTPDADEFSRLYRVWVSFSAIRRSDLRPIAPLPRLFHPRLSPLSRPLIRRASAGMCIRIYGRMSIPCMMRCIEFCNPFAEDMIFSGAAAHEIRLKYISSPRMIERCPLPPTIPIRSALTPRGGSKTIIVIIVQ